MLQRRLQADRETVWSEVETRAAEWTLLLQIDQADLVQARLVEGTIYYMIRKSTFLPASSRGLKSLMRGQSAGAAARPVRGRQIRPIQARA
jgi:hypothetical protein